MKRKLGKAISTTDFFLTNDVNSSKTSQSHSRSIGSNSPFARGLLREPFAMAGVLIGAGVPSFSVGRAKNFPRIPEPATLELS